jgi:hypothetical protein
MRLQDLILVGALLTAAATAAATEAPSATATDRTLIKHARLDQNAAIVHHDLDAIASYWTDDVTICRGLGLQLAGKAAYLKLFAEDDPTSKEVVVYERIPSAIDTSSVWPWRLKAARGRDISGAPKARQSFRAGIRRSGSSGRINGSFGPKCSSPWTVSAKVSR